MIDLLRRGEGVVKVIEHGRTRLETQSTRGKPPATIVRATVRRRRCAAGRRTTPCSACTCRRTPARRGRVDDAAHRHDGKTHQFHRALVARESAAAGHGFERHGLAAFAGCHLCVSRGCAVENAEGPAPSSGGTGTSTPSSRRRVDGVGAMIQRSRRRAARI